MLTKKNLLVVLLFLVGCSSVFGQNYYEWLGPGTNWSDNSNWDSPLVYGQLEFRGANSYTSINDISPSDNQWRLFFASPGPYTISGNPIYLYDFAVGGNNLHSWILDESAGNLDNTIECDIVFADVNNTDAYITKRGFSSIGSLNLSNLEIAGTITDLFFSTDLPYAPIKVFGEISGIGKSIHIGDNMTTFESGNSHVEFHAPCTYTGDTYLENGELHLFGSGDLNDLTDLVVFTDASIVLHDQDLQVNSISGGGGINLGANNLTVLGNYAGNKTSPNISGSGSLIKEGNGELTISTLTPSYTGITDVRDGIVHLQSDLSSNEIIVRSGAVVELASNIFINNLTIEPGGIFDQNDFSLTINGDLNIEGEYIATLGDEPLTVNGNVFVNGGNFYLPQANTGALFLYSDFIKTAGNFIPGEGRLYFLGSENHIFQSNTTETIKYFRNDGSISINSSIRIPESGEILLQGVSQTQISTGVNLILEDYAWLIINSVNPCNVLGSIINQGTLGATIVSNNSNLIFNSSGEYQHNMTRSGLTNLGAIPQATWNAGSTCLINGITNPTTNTFTPQDCLNQEFYHFEWNCPGQTIDANLSGELGTINGDFTINSTGNGNLRLVVGSPALAGLEVQGDLNVNGGEMQLSGGSSQMRLVLGGDLNVSSGTIDVDGASPEGLIEFAGSGQQVANVSTGSADGVSYRLINANNLEIPDQSNLNVVSGATFYRSLGSVLLDGTGSLTYNGGRLAYDGSNLITTESIEFPSCGGPASLKIDNSAGVILHDERTLSESLELSTGLLKLANNDLTILSGGSISGNYGTDTYIETEGSGMFVYEIPAGMEEDYFYPIGIGNYSPMAFFINNGSISREIGFRAVDAIHPDLNTGGSQSNYISRYWVGTNSNAGDYGYVLSSYYNDADVVGSESAIRLNRWDGTSWSQIGTSVNTSINYLGSSAILNESTEPISGTFELTGRVAPMSISVNENLEEFTTIEPNPSAEQSFEISATSLTDDITITAPAGFSVSQTSGGPFSSSLTIQVFSGNLSSTNVFLQLDGAAAGSYSGDVIISTTGLTNIAVPITGTVLSPNTAIIDFDDSDNWTASGNIVTYEIDHTYSEQSWIFTGGPARRVNSTLQDGVPGALDVYSWNLENLASTEWSATYTGDGSVFSFGFKVRRWDGNPSPNFNVEYSVDGGSVFSAPLATINNSYLNNSSNWKTFNYDIPGGQAIGSGELIVRVSAQGFTERIMIDDFSFDIEPNTCANPSVYFQSSTSGLWSNSNTWQTRTSATGPWEPAECSPNADAILITIQDGHTVTVNNDIEFTDLIVETNAALESIAGTISLQPSAELANSIEINSGGLLHFNGGNTPVFNSTSSINVSTGAIIRVSDAVAGISSALAGNGSAGKVFYETDAVFEWNTNGIFSSSNQDYFPNANASTIPIFRLNQAVGGLGAVSPTTFNGILDLNANLTFQNSGDKVFRNGIRGSGNLIQSNTGPCGQFRISEGAVMDGTGIIELNSNGLIIESGAELTLNSNKTINDIGTSNPTIVIEGILNDGGYGIQGNYDNVSISSGAIVNVINPNGFAGLNATFGNTAASYNIDNASLIDYHRSGNQLVTSLTNYGELNIRGSGTKTFESGSFTVYGDLLIENSGQIGSQVGAEVLPKAGFTVGFSVVFENSAYDNLSIHFNGSSDQLITSLVNISCLNFAITKNSNFGFNGSISELNVKGNWDSNLSGAGVFDNSGIDLNIGGNVFLRGNASNYSLTGNLRLTGETGSSQLLEGNNSTWEILPLIDNLIIGGENGSPEPNVIVSNSVGINVDGSVDIQEGVLSMSGGLFTLKGNWSNYAESGFGEGFTRMFFNGSSDQTLTCPGGEYFSSITVDKPGSQLVLNNNLTLWGDGSEIIDMTAGSSINYDAHTLTLEGDNNPPGTSIRVNGGICEMHGSGSGKLLITNGPKAVVSASSGSLSFYGDIQLENGLDFGSSDVSTIHANRVIRISPGGYVNNNPPVYEVGSTLSYAYLGDYDRNNEWNALSNSGYPFNIEILGTNLYLSNEALPGSLNGELEIAGDLLIDDQGSLFIGGNPYNGLEVKGTVTMGGNDFGNLYLGDVTGADLRIGQDFINNNGSLFLNDREVEMNGTGNAQNITGLTEFDYLAINNNGGSVNINNDVTIYKRLRLSEGVLNLALNDIIMFNESIIRRESSSATMSKSPITLNSDRYDIQYSSDSYLTHNEWSTNQDLVRDVRIEGAITLSISETLAFNRNLTLSGSNIDLNGNSLVARGRVPEPEGFSGFIQVDQPGERLITGITGSSFEITGLGENNPVERTKTVATFDGASLRFDSDVTVKIGDGQVDFGEFYPTTIDGTLEVLPGGSVGILLNPCYFGENSLLLFANASDFQVDNASKTWNSGEIFSGDPGIPYNVKVEGATTDLVLNAPRALRNDLIIEGGTFTLTENSGTFQIGGNWNRSGSTSQFNHNEQKVIFDGTGPQTITTVNLPDGSETFFKLTLANSGLKTLNENITVLDSLRLEGTGGLNQNGQTIFVGGNWTNSTGQSILQENGEVVFNGATQQVINSVDIEVFDELQVNNSSELSEGVLLENNIQIVGAVNFQNGLIHPETNQEIIMGENAITIGGNYRSYMSGRVSKNGFSTTDAILFPVGYFDVAGPGDTTNVWQPAELIPESGDLTANFNVQYFHLNAIPGTNYPSNPPSVDFSLFSASTCNHWIINEVSGSSDMKVRLHWNDSTTCFEIGDPIELRVARLNSSEVWESKGNTNVSSNLPYSNGWVESEFVSDFSPFALGTADGINVLPIELLSFIAKNINNEEVLLEWATATETNNDFFTLERSIDGVNFEIIGTVDGAGNSSSTLHYSFVDDDPYGGISYYRLKQTDFDGSFAYSDLEAVEIQSDDKFDLNAVYASDGGVRLIYTSENPFLALEIFDMTGQLVHRQRIENKGNTLIHPNIARGIYLLRLSNGSQMATEKFFY